LDQPFSWIADACLLDSRGAPAEIPSINITVPTARRLPCTDRTEDVMRTLVRSFVLCLLVAVALAAARGAGVSIRGKVVDSAGAEIPGATIEVILNGVQVAKVVSDAKGEFSVSDLAPGEYVVTASLTGFQTASQRILLVEGKKPAPLQLRLEIGSLAETVTVTASSPLLMTQSSSVWTTPSLYSTADYDPIKENGFRRVADAPLSTFSIDVDTASYANVRRFLKDGSLPPADAVRVEELINYFHFDYPAPRDGRPFSVTTELGPCPWNTRHDLVLIGLHSAPIVAVKTPPRNLVFLLDVSGSMAPWNRLPLVQAAMVMLTNTLRPQDRVAIVVYAGDSGLALPSTSGARKSQIERAIRDLGAGGSTNGAEGIELAYRIAGEHFVKDGINRVILATDGDFNVGVTSDAELVKLIERKREAGVFLSVLGVGDDNLNDAMMEKLADAGNGNYSYLDSLQEAQRVLVAEAGATLVTVAKDVKIQVEFNPQLVQGYRLIGYEDRALANEDFKDDRKDAGDMGAGHSVTALYEIVRAGKADQSLPSVDPLKYQTAAAVKMGHADELMTVKLRYKAPDGDVSEPMDVPVKSRFGDAPNLGFAAAVAEFGMLLRDSPFKAKASWRHASDLATQNLGHDPDGYRAEFVRLIGLAASLKRRDATGTK
jgi:Ca-activated chloride channel family protein